MGPHTLAIPLRALCGPRRSYRSGLRGRGARRTSANRGQRNARCSGGNRAAQDIALPMEISPAFFRVIAHFFLPPLAQPGPGQHVPSPRDRGLNHSYSVSAIRGSSLPNLPRGMNPSSRPPRGSLGVGVRSRPAPAQGPPDASPLTNGRGKGPYWMTLASRRAGLGASSSSQRPGEGDCSGLPSGCAPRRIGKTLRR